MINEYFDDINIFNYMVVPMFKIIESIKSAMISIKEEIKKLVKKCKIKIIICILLNLNEIMIEREEKKKKKGSSCVNYLIQV